MTCAGPFKDGSETMGIGVGTEEFYRTEIHRLRRLLDAAELGQIVIIQFSKNQTFDVNFCFRVSAEKTKDLLLLESCRIY